MRILTSVLSTVVLAALLGGCGNSSGSGSKPTARTDVEPGKYKAPGADLSTATGNTDPTGGKKTKGGEGDKKKEGG